MSKMMEHFVVFSDRLLIEPKLDNNKTAAGLFLPPGVQEKEKIQSGYVLKRGPGYAIPSSKGEDTPWESGGHSEIQYIPLEAQIGDLVIYLRDRAYEIEYQKKQYLIVSQAAILLAIRED